MVGEQSDMEPHVTALEESFAQSTQTQTQFLEEVKWAEKFIFGAHVERKDKFNYSQIKFIDKVTSELKLISTAIKQIKLGLT